jgi:hypothetical protein
MLTLELEASEANFKRVKASLALDDSEVDADFGLLAISPKRHLYTMLVDPDAANRVRAHEKVRRISSNPTVEAAEI